MLNSWKGLFSYLELDESVNKLINQIYITKQNVFPNKEDVLKLFDLVEVDQIKVVIIGQDPYYKLNQANGIAFSASNDVSTPRSLKNIFKELWNDLKIDHFENNDLTDWVKQGVLMINTSWTVIENQPASHANIGWEKIVIKLLNYLNERNNKIVYCLWGNYANNLYLKLDNKVETIIHSAHPSPLSYKRGFENSKPFSKINKYLLNIGVSEIDWSK